MKKLIVIVIVCAAAVYAYQAMQPKTPPPPPPAATAPVSASAAPTGEKDLSKAAPALQAYLNKNMSTFAYKTPLPLREIMETWEKFNKDGIKIDVSPDADGTAMGTYNNIARKDLLTELCRQCQCDWEVSGPTTIHIKKL